VDKGKSLWGLPEMDERKNEIKTEDLRIGGDWEVALLD